MSLYVGDRLVCRCTLDSHLHRVTYTRYCINTIVSPDDEHRGAQKHEDNWNKHIRKKKCVSSWLFTRTMTNVDDKVPCFSEQHYKLLPVQPSNYLYSLPITWTIYTKDVQ